MIPLSTPCSLAKTILKCPLHLKEERIGRFEGLPQFKWNDLGEQGQGSFGAVFTTKTRNKDGDLARKVKTVVVKTSPAFKDSRLKKIPRFKDSRF